MSIHLSELLWWWWGSVLFIPTNTSPPRFLIEALTSNLLDYILLFPEKEAKSVSSASQKTN
jgi:hypothetical protein